MFVFCFVFLRQNAQRDVISARQLKLLTAKSLTIKKKKKKEEKKKAPKAFQQAVPIMSTGQKRTKAPGQLLQNQDGQLSV